ncbi:hypothetical protein J4443_03400 [Candidatus Woesearchaeota archaeon]|nr:hypothetical protein [Candidatus Woesearchaeota archaeon]
MPNYVLKVSELVQLSPTAKAVRLGLDGKPFIFQPGQFVMMELDLEKTGRFKVKGGKSKIQKRPFSMSSTPLQQKYLEVTVKTTEDSFVSDYFVNYLQLGEVVGVTGPFGKFFLDEKSAKPNIMLIGAGSGISPLMSMLRHIYQKNLKIRTHTLYSNRTENEILWRKEIESISSSSKNFSHEFTLTRESWKGTTGRINKDMIVGSGFNLSETDFYLCGSPDFVKMMEKLLTEELNINNERVKKEVYN